LADEAKLSGEERGQREYYDAIAAVYDSHYGAPPALRYRAWVYDLVLKNLPLAGKTALDAMCGGGEATAYLSARGAKTVGLDLSGECCRIYAGRHPRSRVVCASILRTGFPDSTFDFVLTDSLHHLHPHIDAGMEEIHRILKPGGSFCCWEPGSGSLPDRFRRVWYRLDRRYFGENEKSVDLSGLERGLAGRFRTVSAVHGGGPAYLFVNCSMAFRIPGRLVRWYAPGLMRLEKTLLRFQNRLLSMWVICLMRKAGGGGAFEDPSVPSASTGPGEG
jgi:SAM-dependent methyltransferase